MMEISCHALDGVEGVGWGVRGRGCKRRYADPVPKRLESSLAVVPIVGSGHARKGERLGLWVEGVCVV